MVVTGTRHVALLVETSNAYARGLLVGVKKYVDSHPELSKMTAGFYSQCMGGNSQYHAIHRRPELFENVRCMVSPMVVSMSAIYDAFSDLQGVRQYQELIDLELLKMGAFVAAEMTPHLWAASVKMPVLMIQVLKDSWTRKSGRRPKDL